MSNAIRYSAAVLLAVFCAAPVVAQVPSTGDFSFTMLTNEGGQFSHMYVVEFPVTEQMEQTYTVNVPYTEQVEIDGRVETRTKMRVETRTRLVPVTRMVSEQRMRMVAPDTLTTVGGQPANTNFQGQMPAIQLNPGVELNDFHRAVFRPEVIVIRGPALANPDAAPVPAPEPGQGG